MRYRTFALIVLILGSASVAKAQTVESTSTEESKLTLQQQLMPESVVALIAPASQEATQSIEASASQPALMMMPRGSGTGFMIAGAALLVAGLLIDGDAGTLVAVTGAAVGAYGLYLYFR